MRYPGGKGRSYPQLINLMPPHTTYVETHLGGGAVLRRKAPCARTVGIDIDPAVIAAWQETGPKEGCELILGDATQWLLENDLEPTACIYADPPYLAGTRKRRKVYKHEYTEKDHVDLLEALRTKSCPVIISGYRNGLYDEMLVDWNCRTFLAATHTGLREESVWFNFQPPKKLHDPRYIGADFREREAIRRRRARLEKRVAGLTLPERHSFYQWLGDQLFGAVT